ncbi:MAG: hypothetical protein H0Z34_16180 [Brevibacillus sp.]|nr:hypothetical protein [Brevibacillus sp.]
MNTSGAFFRAHLRWPTSEEAGQDRFTTIRRGSGKTMSCSDVVLLPLRFPCGCVVSLAGWPNRSLAKNRPHSFPSESFEIRPVRFGLAKRTVQPRWWLKAE